MMDIKKNEIYSAYNDIFPRENMTSIMDIALHNAQTNNMILALTLPITILPVKRPIMKSNMPPKAKNCEALTGVIVGSSSVT